MSDIMWSSSTRELFVKLYGHLKRKIKDQDIQARLHSNGLKALVFFMTLRTNAPQIDRLQTS